MLHTDEFGPLLREWMRLPQGTVESFDAALPWQVAAALGVGPYRRPDADSSEGGGVTSRRGGSVNYPHPRSQRELLRMRHLHAKDPERYPKPEPIWNDSGGLRRGLADR